MIEKMAGKLFVGGEWVGEASRGETFDVLNPATGEAIATLPDGGREETQRAVDAAAAVQPSWAATTAAYRAGILKKAVALMHDRSEHLARVMTLEQGKPLAESRGEISYAASFLESGVARWWVNRGCTGDVLKTLR